MSNVQMLLSQKMALERMIEQARVAELDRQRQIEAETLALRNAEIASAPVFDSCRLATPHNFQRNQ